MELGTSSLMRLPVDVLQNLILLQLNSASILACSLACAGLRKISARLVAINASKFDHQRGILKEIFRFGSLELFVYFKEHLKYPNLYPFSQLIIQCLERAAEGPYNSSLIFSS